MDADLFPARVRDTAQLCERTATPRFLGFLTPSEAAVALTVIRGFSCKTAFFGGYESAERTVLACLPDWCEEPDFPITAVTLKYRTCDRLTHRDFLGSLMGLGITRESVGDILCEPGRAVIFLSNDILRYVTEQLRKVGAVGVEITPGAEEPLPQVSKKVSATDTVASLRLDCVVSALCGCSRKAASEYISHGLVRIGSVACDKGTHTVAAGDSVTVRGVGKFSIENVDSLSRKGRIILKYSKYV